MKITKQKLESLYKKYNRREYVHPDPLEFLYNYKDKCDQEVVGLIASSLAYGNVKQILKSVSKALSVMGKSPHDYIIKTSESEFGEDFKGFKHRFTTGSDIAKLLGSIKRVLKKHGSLKRCFKSHLKKNHVNIIPALTGFVNELTAGQNTYLLPSPEKGSACKRLNLFLRWMARSDAVDPGGWDIPISKLVIPLDVHMHRMGRTIGFTKRKQGSLKTALEITEGFAKLHPKDPTKYDFSLTRLGIRRINADYEVPEVEVELAQYQN